MPAFADFKQASVDVPRFRIRPEGVGYVLFPVHFAKRVKALTPRLPMNGISPDSMRMLSPHAAVDVVKRLVEQREGRSLVSGHSEHESARVRIGHDADEGFPVLACYVALDRFFRAPFAFVSDMPVDAASVFAPKAALFVLIGHGFDPLSHNS